MNGWKWDITVTRTHFEATYHTTLTFWKGPVLINCLDLSGLLSRWYHLNWYEFFKRWFTFKKRYIRAGSLVLRMQLTSRRLSGNLQPDLGSRSSSSHLVAPTVIPQGFGGRPFWGVWTMSLRSQRQKRSVMSFPRKSHGVQQMQKPFNKQ